ncbi:hypothetical protein GA0061096_3533 [Fictibacillus enclensis]|nr:hypothetical protein [Fictibacillus enclensis]SCC28180.1 hypothetical protein GA0061096_3533 [Fictibacillus enclensis]
MFRIRKAYGGEPYVFSVMGLMLLVIIVRIVQVEKRLKELDK